MTVQKQERDYWTSDGAFFVCDGWKYGIAPDGSTVCVGRATGANHKPQNRKLGVSKIAQGQPLREMVKRPQNNGIMKHLGRPRKEGDQISRVTKWRRAKETQDVLV